MACANRISSPTEPPSSRSEQRCVIWQRFQRDKLKLLTEPCNSLEHDPAFQSEDGKAKKTEQRHLEVTITFERSEKRQVIGPLSSRPIIPELPQ